MKRILVPVGLLAVLLLALLLRTSSSGGKRAPTNEVRVIWNAQDGKLTLMPPSNAYATFTVVADLPRTNAAPGKTNAPGSPPNK